MIPVSETNDYFRALLELPEFSDLAGVKSVVDDSHASGKLRSASGIQLVVVMPTVTQWGDSNNNRQQSTLMLFVVEKTSGPAGDDETEEVSYNRLQQLICRLVQRIKDDASQGDRRWYNVGDADIEFDPEYNVFGGWNGWSATFVF